MRNPQNMLISLTKHSNNKNYKYERLYRLLYNEEMYLTAYQRIYTNEGNMTKGTDNQTIDGMSLKRITNIINSLRNESYQPKPSRRTYIPKKNGKLRPLGIPSFEDKLLQEVIRMILESIYEGYFEETSHGFRPNKSCHTALSKIQATFTGVKWFIEGDIKSFFDNINHDKMINILSERINDQRFMRLIRKFLNAGYMEEWTFHKTFSGCPQGGIISPILANIYLDKFDKYMKEYVKLFRNGKRREVTLEYRQNKDALRLARVEFSKAVNETEKYKAITKIRELEKARVFIPYGNPMDTEYKRLIYIRYADDWLCGVIGSKEECRKIKEDIKTFLAEKLQLELSEEKTLITNAKDKANFLSYKIYVRKSNLSKRDKAGRLVRNYTGRVVLEVSTDIIKKRLIDYSAMKLTYHQDKEVWKPTARYNMKDCDDLEILDRYNSEIRGFYNYYCIANNSSIINSFKYIMEYSMYKTYATKYRTTKADIIEKFRINKDFGIRYKNSKGIERVRLFYNEGFKRQKECLRKNADLIPDGIKYFSSTSLIERLRANKCEICGKENATIEIHHIRKLKDLQGKNFWETLMIARRRKTLALCLECHKKLHCGKLD
ncbi:reverse transcriptase domain-containing protein [Clostridium cellulovorans]|uniref:RNA-directed DNA polymerase (Reverse transcriptase) n=1 Tax=Clostridium cellulovorans (strain ATCC 35296 / DSM 3052 / OCM 3 / 743B) TaxID=573061 RepID=D9SPT3_CLOC7|nr:reverse transcriptase domain-containing protein [Clostridium cellulovorans]ADL52069.1 RNA-directed DNA polymerase (Reverse transcriptase) [Clostridium cellulovorans 743B]